MAHYIAIIPARGGSKRIPGKNIVRLGKKHLIEYTIEAALKTKLISKTIVSTDNKNISDIAMQFDVEIEFPRPAYLASDTATTIEVVQNIMKSESSKSIQPSIVLLQPTSPFRTATHIESAIHHFEDTCADTLTSVIQAREHPFWLWRKIGEDIQPYLTINHIKMGRESLPKFFIENGAIYIFKSALLSRNTLYGEKIVPFEMDSLSSIDIDELIDLYYAEFLLANNYISVSL